MATSTVQQKRATTAIELAVEGGIAAVTLNRPQLRNAVDDGMRAGLIEVLDYVSRDDEVLALVLTGRPVATRDEMPHEPERHQPGDTVSLSLQRAGKAPELKLRLGQPQ